MSLKGFHIVFIVFSTLMALGVGSWCVWVDLVEGAPIYLAGAIASFATAVARPDDQQVAVPGGADELLGGEAANRTHLHRRGPRRPGVLKRLFGGLLGSLAF